MKVFYHKYIVVVLLFSFMFVPLAIAQKSKTDSLLLLLKKDKEDTSKINHLNLIGREVMYSNPDTAIILSNEALSTAEKLDWKKGVANSCGNLGICYYLKSDYSRALDYYQKALKIDEETNDKIGIATRLGNIGLIYKNQSDYPKALEFYLKALKIDEQLGDKYGMAADLSNIGIVYEEQTNYPKALDYYFKGLKLDEVLKDKNGIASDYANIGVVYKNQKEYPEAIGYYFMALKMAEELGNKQLQANDLGNIGGVYKILGDNSKATPAERNQSLARALDFQFKELKICKELGDKNGISAANGSIASLYIDFKKYKAAYDYMYSALALADSVGAKDYEKIWYNGLSELYEKSDIPLQDTIGGKLLTMEQMRLRALHYFKSFLAVRDTIFSERDKKQLVQKELNYQFEKKENEVKAETDKQAALAASESKKQRFILVLLSCFLFLVLVFAAFIFRALRITSKQKKMIEQQQDILEEKQKEILDSIHYAKRIQTSLLPTVKYIEKQLTRLKAKK